MNEILIATSNKNKIREYRQMLEPYGYSIKSLNDFGPIDIIEDGATFEENALIKARYLHKLTGLRVIADDSGLQIKALNNQPGIYSSRFLGVHTPYHEKNNLVLKMMEDAKDRSARFVCAIALVDCDEEKVFVGEFLGSIAWEARGDHGFGYDPIFYVEEYQKTSAELNPDVKNAISHRGKALKQVLPYLLRKDGKHD